MRARSAARMKEDDKKQVISVEIVEASIDVLAHVAATLLTQNPPFEESEVSRIARKAIGGLPDGVLPLVGLVERFKEDGLLVPVSARDQVRRYCSSTGLSGIPGRYRICVASRGCSGGAGPEGLAWRQRPLRAPSSYTSLMSAGARQFSWDWATWL